MRFINSSATDHVRLPDLKIDAAPGAECIVPDAYASPRLGSNGARLPSVIERLAPQLIPADADELATWRGVPAFEATKTPTVISRSAAVAHALADGHSQGAAEARADFQQAAMSGEKLELSPAEVAATKPKRGRPPKAAVQHAEAKVG
jgi:hypothetical protein